MQEFNKMPLEKLPELFVTAVHNLLTALDKKDTSLILSAKKEVERLFVVMEEIKSNPDIALDAGEVRDIEKQIRGKNKELKTLGKEIKSRRKKRSGAVINDDITRIAGDVEQLNGQIYPGINEQS